MVINSKAKIARELILKMMRDSSHFNTFVTKGCDRVYYSKHLKEMTVELSKYPVYFTNGATRFVIVDSDEEFVIKTDFRKTEKYQYYYTAAESRLYNEAVEDGLQEYFAEISCIGMIGGSVFYIMEYAEVNDEEVEDTAWNYNYGSASYDSVREKLGFSPYCDDSAEEANDALCSKWGVDTTEKVMEFLECHIDGSTDIHSSNIGIKNDTYVLIDYCGY